MTEYNGGLTQDAPWLLVEDNPGDIDLVEAYLSELSEAVPSLVVAGTLVGACELLDREPFEAVLLDLNLPDSVGLDTLDRVVRCTPAVPVIVLTSAGNDALGLEAVSRGAADFLPKDELTGRLLLRSVRYAIERRRRNGLEARFRALVEQSRDLVAILDQDLAIRYVSPSLEHILGYDPIDKLDANAVLEVHPDDQETVVREVGRLREDPSATARLRYRVRHKDGGWRVLDAIAQNRFDDPHIRGLVVHSRDVTEVVEQDQRIRFQAALLHRVGQPVLAVDEDGRITYWNDALEELTGWTRAEAEGREGIPFLVDEADHEIAAEGREAARGGDRWQGEIRYRTKGEGTALMQATVTPAVKPDGSPGGRIVAAVDITELRRAEEEARSAADRLRLQAEMLDAVGQAVIATDPDGRIIYWNDAAMELYGWSADEVIGRPVVEVTPTEQTREQAEEIMAALRAGETWSGEFEVQRRDGSTFPALVTDAPMLNADGMLTAIIGVSSDLTEHKELEDRLRQAQKMEAIGRLAGGVAHDFNNLVTAIDGHAGLLLGEIPEGSPLRENAEEIRSAGRRASRLTRQLLAFSRKQLLEERNVDINTAVVDLENMLRRLVPERIRFDVRAGPDPVVARVDPGQLDQVVVNLVVNAADSIHGDGRIAVAVDTVALSEADVAAFPGHAQAGPYARITVEDTGAGMPPEVLDRAFEPFFTTKEQGRGTGLGLATAYGIVKQSGGHVIFDSAPGRGTTARVLLPWRDEPADRPPERSSRRASGRRGTVLLVEDDDAVRNVARRILARAGHVVVEATNGREALRLADHTVDLVISDVVMPVMGGVELRRKLMEARPGLKMILTSGYSDADLNGGAPPSDAPFIAKPYTAADLIARVAEALED